MAPLLIPSFFVLESGGKYLSVTENNSKSSLPSGFVKFNEENIWSPRTKFAAEPAETGDGALVHIRSCYNNKYLVKEQIGDSFCIVASAKKPEEDRTKATCTLFEPHSLVSEVEQTSVRLRHAQTQIFATHGDDQHGMLISSGPGSALRVIDSKSLVVLPSLVAFKTNEKDRPKYCCSRNLDPSWPYQRFEDGLDIGDLRVAKKMFPTAQGNYRVKDLYFDKFWRRSPNWIWGDAESSNNSNDTLFSVVQIGDNVIALKNLGNNNFCGPLTTEGKTDCLNAQYPTLTNPTMLVLEETVLQRKISDISYRLSDSRIYGEQNMECDHTYATNDSPDEKANITLNFSFTDAKTTSWNDSVSVKFGGKITFETAIIPFIETAKIELALEAGYTHAWGESKTTTFKRESTYSVPVPKKTTVKVTMICSRALCDVPFYYTQTDLLPNGEWVTTIKDDGLFTGMNSYNFRFKSEVVPNPLKN